MKNNLKQTNKQTQTNKEQQQQHSNVSPPSASLLPPPPEKVCVLMQGAFALLENYCVNLAWFQG